MKNIDRYLLLNYRVIWATRIHYVLFYGAIGWVANWALAHLIPISTDSPLPSPAFFATIVGILAGMGLLLWLYKQSVYSIEGEYGHFKKETEYLRLGIYLLAIGSFVMQPAATGYWVLKRNASLVSNTQLNEDAEALNDGNIFFPDGSDKFSDNIYELFDCWGLEIEDITKAPPMVPAGCAKKYRYQLFSSIYRYDERGSAANDLYFKITSLLTMPETKQETMAATYLSLMEKYGAAIDQFPTNPIQKFKAHQLSQVDMRQKELVQRQLREIASYNNSFARLEAGFAFSSLCILVFMLSVMLQLYHGLGLKDFIISAIVTILISLGTAIATVFIVGDIPPLFFVAFFVYVVSLVTGLGARSATKYSRIQAVALAFANFYTPLLPVLLSFMLIDTSIGKGNEVGILLGAAIFGCVLHAIFFAPPFWQLQAHVRSLPRD